MTEAIQYQCPTHDAPLQHVMSSGAGWCPTCNLFVQANGIDQPQLDEHVKAKRAAAMKAATPKLSGKRQKPKRRKKAAAKLKRAASPA